jgi:DNA repair protein RadC
MAKALLHGFGNMNRLSKAEVEDLQIYSGLKASQSLALLAAFELGWRLCRRPWEPGQVFSGPRQVFESFRSSVGRERVEVVWVLLLDCRLRLMDSLEISRGAVSGALVHPREVLKPVVSRQAAAFILLHNHPSGDPQPSPEDFLVTRQISQAAHIFRIDFIDHIILTPHAYESLADRREMGKPKFDG